MSLADALLLDSVTFNVWVALRTDGISGSGTPGDPFNGSVRRELGIPLVLTRGVADTREATANTGSFDILARGFAEGDLVTISGVTSDENKEVWNGTFVIYGVTQFSFKYYMKRPPAGSLTGSPMCERILGFGFDEVMRNAPSKSKICLGPGVFQTRGYAANDERGWQPKTGQKIVGEGIDVTVLQLVGAENADQHYHVVGMPIETAGPTAITPLQSFEISDLTIDCNADNQPVRFDLHPATPWANVACGAVRVPGSHTRINRVKAINWGTKSLKQGCFVLSIIQASGQPSGGDGNPIVTATDFNEIVDCVAIQPSKSNARETTVLHIGGVKNITNHAQGFGTAACIRQNFVDAQYLTTLGPSRPVASPFPSHFLTSKTSTLITGDTGGGGRRLGERVL